MVQTLRRLLVFAAAGATLAAVPMTAQGPVVLFSGDFDPKPGGSAVPFPSAGAFVYAVGSQGINLVPTADGGYALAIGANGGQEVALAAVFDGGAGVDQGTVRFDFDLTPAQAESIFLAGAVLDNPSSDFIPSTGTGEDGLFDAGPENTSIVVNAGVTYHVSATYSRPSPQQDWKLAVKILEPGAGTFGPVDVYESVLLGTAQSTMYGIAFRKTGALPGVFAIDDVEVVQVLSR